MPVVIGCLAPHPPVIVPEVGRDNIKSIEATRRAMETLAEDITRAKPETMVIVSPHSPGFTNSVAVRASEKLSGSFANFGAPHVSFEVDSDQAFTDELIKAANDLKISVAKIGPGYTELIGSGQLDHGALVPLYFIRKRIKTPISLISISYEGFDEHYALGMAIRKASDAIPKRVALVASGDLSHRLTPDAPAGYNPRAVDFDAKIEEIFNTGYFDELKDIDSTLVTAAGECGLRSMYTLAGAFNGYDVRTKVLSYEAPFGVGYLVSMVYPVKPLPERDLYTTEIKELPLTEPQLNAPVRIARYSLEQYFKQGHPVGPPEDTPAELLDKSAGVFVCLKTNGDLRGCVGTIYPMRGNIAEEIMANAIQAAEADPGFSPVTLDEVPSLQFTVDILEEPERIHSKERLDPQVYGVIVKSGYRTGLLLPDIKGVETADQQIMIAKQKAGIKNLEEVELYRFRVIRYE